MASKETRCNECGAAIPADSPSRLCAKCLFGLALEGEHAGVWDPEAPGHAPEVGPELEGGGTDMTIAVATPLTEKVGDRIGRYKLLQQIGEGGFGVVYMAQQVEPVKRRVALKIIKLGMDTKQVVARFEAERQALALLDHPNIAKVLDAGATETGRPYFVMELVHGVKVTEYCDENQLPTQQRLELFILICRAVQHAHQKGIIHRDIKPSNILVTLHDGVPVPKIIDFGIAKATQAELTEQTVFTHFGQFLGTPAYMSPEQAEMSCLDVDTRSDIYSLGVLLYELLTGDTPLEPVRLVKAGLDEIRRIIREEEPPKPSAKLQTLPGAKQNTVARQRQSEPLKLVHRIRGDLDWIVMKCLEKDRGRRYETANGLAMDLQRHLEQQPVAAGPPSRLYRFQKLVRRNKGVFAAGGAVLAALIAGAIVSTWLFFNERSARARAVVAEQRQGQLLSQALTAEKAARTQAERADRNAAQAEASAGEVRRTLAQSDLLQALRLTAEDKTPNALAYLQRSLSLEPTNRAAVIRLTSLLSSHRWMVPSFSLKHEGRVVASHFSPDGKRIVTASGKAAWIWDARTGQPLGEPMKHDVFVNSVEFSPEGDRVVTVCGEHGLGLKRGSVQVWNISSGQEPIEPLRACAGLLSAHFSPDGKRIVTASADSPTNGTVRVWDAQTGQPLTEPMKDSPFVKDAQFSPDGQRIVTVSSGLLTNGSARVWDARSGRPLTEPIRDGAVMILAQFSPDGRSFVTAANSVVQASNGGYLPTNGSVRVWDAQTGTPLTQPMRHAGAVWSAQFSPDNTRIVTAAGDSFASGSARVWDVRTGRQLTEPMKHASWFVSARFDSSGNWIVTASADGSARVWDAHSGKPLTEPMKDPNPVDSAQFSADGNCIMTTSHDGTVRIWATGISLIGQLAAMPMNHSARIKSAQFSPDARQVVTASWDGTAQVWDAPDGQHSGAPIKHSGPLQSAQFSPDNQRIVTACLEQAQVWDAQSGRRVTEPMEHSGSVLSAEFSPDGSLIVTASGDGTARVWDARNGQPVGPPIKHTARLLFAQFSPDGRRIVTASWDGTACVWDVASARVVVPSIRLKGPVYSARFSPKGDRIVTASPDGARVWQIESGVPITEPMNEPGADVSSAQFSPDGSLIVTASADGSVRVWDVRSGQPLTEPMKHAGGVSSVQFSPDGKRIVTASENAARIWDLAPTGSAIPEWLPRLAQALSGQVLNENGVLEPSAMEPRTLIELIRRQLSLGAGDNDWTAWGRWLLADPQTRTISPFSKVTVPEYIEKQLKENTAEALAEAEELAFGNAGLLDHLVKADRALKETNQIQQAHGF